MYVFPIAFGRVGFERQLGETGSSIASRFFAGCSTRVEQPGQCVTFFIVSILCVFEYPSNVQRPTSF